MKKLKQTCLLLLTVLALSACSRPVPDKSQLPPPTIAPSGAEDRYTLESLASLIGKEDAQVVQSLGEGAPYRNEGTNSTLLSREYEEKIVNHEAILQVSYDDSGKVIGETIHFEEAIKEKLTQEITQQLGEPTTNSEGNTTDMEKEGGGTIFRMEWQTDQAQISLIESNGTLSISIDTK
ncbi:hypothetical protein MHH52_13925 [Paenibacillus sp. FSL K6-0276]|uniref:hypothetical protein n=1 Tax=Paenibacillus sp. FSL K6-0276 TaxID=2921450 RepID=UPI0030EE4E32